MSRSVGPRPKQQPLLTFALWPFVLPLLLLLAVGFALLFAVSRHVQETGRVTSSHERLGILASLERDVSDIETGERGYLISGDRAYLRPYREASENLRQDLDDLETHAVTQNQRRNARKLRELIVRWEEIAAQPEIEARRVSVETAASLVRDGTGATIMGEARELMALMRYNESMRLFDSLERSKATLQQIVNLTIVGLLMTAFFIVVAALRMAHTMSNSARQVTEAAAQIAAGEYETTLPHSPISEFNRLSEQFETMVHAVQSRELLLKQAKTELISSNERLERSNRELEQFAYIASHDLQEPLRTIGSYTELLGKRYHGQLDARADQYIDFTIAATKRLKNLIQDLLAYSRVSQHEHGFTEVDLDSLAKHVLEELAAKIEAAQATVTVEPLPTVWGSRELLHHVLLNLVGNAVKFRSLQRPAQVKLWAERSSEGWTVHVQDNGIGIAPEYFERIFAVFQRLHTTEQYNGSGIGLPLSRTAIERHGGRLWVESEPDVGSTFSFLIPDSKETPYV